MSYRPSFTLGIEEEYFVVDRATRDLVREPEPGFLTKRPSRPQPILSAPGARKPTPAKSAMTIWPTIWARRCGGC